VSAVLDQLRSEGHNDDDVDVVHLSPARYTDDVDRAAAMFSQSAASVVQFQRNVLTDNPSMVSLIQKEKKIGLIRGPLAMGLLSGKYAVRKASDIDDVRNRTPPWMKYFKEGAPVSGISSSV
jgi:aryl-alcohol dehydrogenase-like predicted oxidoreductase